MAELEMGLPRHKGGHHGKKKHGPIETLLAKTLGEDAVDDTVPREPTLAGMDGSKMPSQQRAAMFARQRNAAKI